MQLDHPPADIDDLYFDRGDPVDPWRPVMPGDVFAGVGLPGLEPHEFLVVITHPCSMRGKHGALVPRLQAVVVRPHQKVAAGQWANGFLRVMPLPGLVPGSDAFYAAYLNEIGTVKSEELDLANRRASLSDLGVLLLQQRFIANLARVSVKRSTLEAESAHVFAEAELLEEWLTELAKRRSEAGEDLHAALADESRCFDEFLSSTDREPPLRVQLLDSATRASVRRAVRAEIDARRSGSG